MPDRELVLRTGCPECGMNLPGAVHGDKGKWCLNPGCNGPGGSETVLDPERVVENVSVMQDVTTVADVRVRWFLDALGGSDE